MGRPIRKRDSIREILRRGRSLAGVTEIAAGTQDAIPLNHDKNLISFVLEESSTRSDLPHQVRGIERDAGLFSPAGNSPASAAVSSPNSTSRRRPALPWSTRHLRGHGGPSEDPLGKRIKLGRAATSWTTVVGVVTDARTETLEDTNIPQMYFSSWQRTDKNLAIFLRGRLGTAALPEQARAMVQSLNPELPVFGAKRLPDVVSGSLAQRRFSLEMVLLFGFTALLLAGIGVYGTISYIVSGRTRDIGIRIALGAQRKTILHMVLSQGLALALAGAAVGLAGALIVSHLMAGLLYGVSPSDPLTFIGLTVVLVVGWRRGMLYPRAPRYTGGPNRCFARGLNTRRGIFEKA